MGDKIMNDLSRYILAIVLAMIILFSWQIFFPAEQSVYNQEEDSIDMSIEEIEISKINKALLMIEKNEYGYCTCCGDSIGIERLQARLTATQCIDCKKFSEYLENINK